MHRRRKGRVLVMLGLGLTVLVLAASPAVASYVASMPALKGRSSCEEEVRALGLPAEPVTFPSDDGLILRGWFFPSDDASAPAVIYVHGSGASPREGLGLVGPLHEAGYHVLLFSYRNHGLSDNDWMAGVSYGARESRDVDAAIRYVHDVRGVSRIALQGFSMGAVGVLLSAARNPDVVAVVAESPYASFEQVWAANGRPVPEFFIQATRALVTRMRGFNGDDIQPVRAVGQIGPRPLLLIHGTADAHIPWRQSQALFQAAGEPKTLWLVDGAHHGDARLLYPDRYHSLLLEFYRRAFS